MPHRRHSYKSFQTRQRYCLLSFIVSDLSRSFMLSATLDSYRTLVVPVPTRFMTYISPRFICLIVFICLLAVLSARFRYVEAGRSWWHEVRLPTYVFVIAIVKYQHAFFEF